MSVGRDERSGATALEMALLLPVLMFVILGVVDTGMMMITGAEVTDAANAAVRQLRTGAIQASPTGAASTYAGATNCANPSFVLPANENCLGFNYSASDTASTIFGELLCSSLPTGSATATCTGFNWTVIGYATWDDFNGALPNLTYNTDGTPSVTFPATTAIGAQAIVVSMVGYKYKFFTPLIGCVFDASDCLVGKSPQVVLNSFAVFEAEPFGVSTGS
jgi:hypothetical protein